MSLVGRIAQISISGGGVPKLRVEEARVTVTGLEGDAHRNLAHHGGPDRAVCLYSSEALHELAAEGHAVQPGTLGENVTVEKIDWATLTPGTYVALGNSVVLQVTRYTTPCFKIAAAFRHGDVSRVSQKRRPGWSRVYARVVVEGRIRSGDVVRVLDERAVAAQPEEVSDRAG